MQSVANVLGMVTLYLIVGLWAAQSIWKAYRIETDPDPTLSIEHDADNIRNW